MSTFQIIPEGEPAAKATTIEGKVVDVTRTTRRNKDEPRIAMTWKLDFSECSEEDIIELATRSAVIHFQGVFRKEQNPNPEEWNDRQFNVKTELCDAERKARGPKEVTAADIAKLSPERRKAIMEALLAMEDEQE